MGLPQCHDKQSCGLAGQSATGFDRGWIYLLLGCPQQPKDGGAPRYAYFLRFGAFDAVELQIILLKKAA